MSIGSQIKEYRKNKNLTQTELGNKLGVNQEKIFGWENDLEFPSDAELTKIARVLNVSFSDFIQNKELKEISYESTFGKANDSVFQKYLNLGEKTIWTGSPKYPIGQHTIPVKLFGLFFLGFSLFWTIMAFQIADFMGLFGIPFIIVGSFIIFRNKKFGSKFQRQAFYAVTDERIMIVMISDTEEMTNVALDQLSNVITSPGAYGTKTIVFYTRNTYGMNNSHPYFFNLENGEYVANLINKQREKRKQ